MVLSEIFLISVGLAMDAFAVSICKGLSLKKMNYKKAIMVGLWFGIFQAGMPILGYLLGATFERIVTMYDHWIAFILLSLIGGKMIAESLNKKRGGDIEDINIKSMFILAVATSIDALAVGIAYVCAYGKTNATLTFITIGMITFLLSILGVKIGNKYGNKYEKKAEFIGGSILITLGIKILCEHLEIL